MDEVVAAYLHLYGLEDLLTFVAKGIGDYVDSYHEHPMSEFAKRVHIDACCAVYAERNRVANLNQEGDHAST